MNLWMNKEKAYSFLTNTVNSIAPVPQKLIDEFFEICSIKLYKKGDYFLRAGETPRIMGLNCKGIFRYYYIDSRGTELTKFFCTSANFVASYSALVQETPSHFYIQAATNSEILQFDYWKWRELIDKDLQWYPFVFKLIESVYIIKEIREKSFLLDDAATRYKNFNREFPGLESKIKLYHIASYLGITPEALSRIRKKLKLI